MPSSNSRCRSRPTNSCASFTRWPRALFPGAIDLLATLAPRFRLASVSNTNEIHWRRFRDEWSLDRAFADNFPSHAIGRVKPDRDYFEHVLGTMRVPAKRVLFVDDNAINVEGAARMGIVARQAAGPDDVRKIVAELGN